ncbi:MAG: RluA family pseudouridine synthase, partial [Christensenellales bacterium]
ARGDLHGDRRAAQPQDIPLDIVYEDDLLLVVNKPKGMVVHPAAGNPDGTLVNALLYHCGGSLSGIGGVLRPGIVHRIDKDTSGLLLVAKTDEAHNFLAQQFASHKLGRIYSTIVVGNLRDDEGTIDAPIARHPVDRKGWRWWAERGDHALHRACALSGQRGQTGIYPA